jgi:hypothetical protein
MKKFSVIFGLVLVVSMLLAACQPAAPAATEAPAAPAAPAATEAPAAPAAPAETLVAYSQAELVNAWRVTNQAAC